MTEITGNKLEAEPVTAPDAHGQAAMFLVESLIHGLIDSKAMTVAGAVEVVDIAAEVQADVAADAGADPVLVRKSVELLEAISASLSRDVLR